MVPTGRGGGAAKRGANAVPWRGDEVSEGKSKAGGGKGGGGADGVVHRDAAVDEVPGVRQGHEVEQEVRGPGHGPVVGVVV